MPKYEEKNAQILGASFDNVEDNRKFAEKFKFPFPLLCDTDRKIGLAYGAALNLHRTLLSGVLPQRRRYVDFDHSLITGCSRMDQRFTRYSYVITLAAEVHPDDVG